MKNSIRYIVAASLSIAATNAIATEGFDFWGYFRAGVGTGADGSASNSIGGSDFQKNKIGRLGNEFDNYAEIGLGKELNNDGDKSVYIQTMFNMWDGDADSVSNDSPFGWENMNLQLRNFMGMGETSWAGIRQYNKGYYIDMNDYFYWNQTNVGAGIERMNLGAGKFSVAVLHRDFENEIGTDTQHSKHQINANNLELTYDSLPLWEGGSLALGYKFLNADPSADQVDEPGSGEHDYSDGHAFMVELNQAVAGTGFNKTVLQYYVDGSAAQGVLMGAADTLNGNVKSGSGYAIRNYGNIPLGDRWDLSHAINYAAADSIETWDNDQLDATMFGASAKLAYHWSEITRTYAEVGYFADEKTENGADYDRSGSKYTVAQAWSLGRNQPELRLYASYFDSDNDNWSDSSHAFEGDDSDDTWVVGVQANVWW
ncbi:carbohydrate porin [Aeromonas media]|uniref:carbohydrate porin n=2 Tax=Aeromonas media TaxID=651 RepID=UPI0035B2FC5C